LCSLALFVKIVVAFFLKKFIGILPHLFHGLLDNEPLIACVQALPATPILNRENVFEAWLMPGIAA